MSVFEQDKFINYQRIEDNLVVVRERYVASLESFPTRAGSFSPGRTLLIRPSLQPQPPSHPF